MPKSKHPKPKDPTLETLKEVLKSEGVKPNRSLVSKLLFFWVQSTAEAQARGTRIRAQADREIYRENHQNG